MRGSPTVRGGMHTTYSTSITVPVGRAGFVGHVLERFTVLRDDADSERRRFMAKTTVAQEGQLDFETRDLGDDTLEEAIAGHLKALLENKSAAKAHNKAKNKLK